MSTFYIGFGFTTSSVLLMLFLSLLKYKLNNNALKVYQNEIAINILKTVERGHNSSDQQVFIITIFKSLLRVGHCHILASKVDYTFKL